MKNIIIGILLTTGLTTLSCTRKGCTDSLASNYDTSAKKDDGSCIYNALNDFDRSKMLANIADNYIIPAYTNYELGVSDLQNKVNYFYANPSIATLQNLKGVWKQSCKDWQSVALIDFGPARDISLKAQSNIYPIDTALINSNISNGNYDLQIPSNFVAKGLQAIDYLLFGTGNNEQEVVDYFLNNIEAKNYLNAVSEELKTNATNVLSSWNSTYKNSFKNNNADNSQGSAVSDLVNALNAHYETYIRKGKVGLPAGVFNGFSQQAMPGHVEGLYSGYSFDFAVESIKAVNKYINGNSFSDNEVGLGLDDYINFVSAKDASGNPLQSTIENQTQTVITSLSSYSTPLSNEVVNNNAQVLETYQEMQKLVPLIKVDLTSALGVLVTYQDNDGD